MATMLQDLLLRNRSYRRFLPDPALTTEDLHQLIELTRYVASAKNEQVLRYSVIQDKNDCARMFPLLSWAGFLKDWSGPSEEEAPTSYLIQMFAGQRSSFTEVDAGIAAQTILLGAVEKGYGGCLLGSVNKSKAQAVFKLPDELEIVQVIALGKPAETCVLAEMQGNDYHYWRDANDIHHVPKRVLKDLLV